MEISLLDFSERSSEAALYLRYSRYRVVERNKGAGHYGDVHHIPEVPHVGALMQNKTLVKNLKKLFCFN